MIKKHYYSWADVEKMCVSIVNQIVEYMENYEDFLPSINKQVTKLNKEFFSGKKLYRVIADGE